MPFVFPAPTPGYTLKRVDPWQTFQAEIGPSIRYSTSKRVRVKTNLSWNLNASQQEAFDEWFLETAESGNQEFSLSLAIGAGGFDTVTVRLDGAHGMTAFRSGSTVRWTLSAPVEFELPDLGWGAPTTTPADWGATSLPLPDMRSWARTVTPSVIRTASNGATFTRIRRRAYYPTEKNPFTMHLTDDQFTTFLTFFENTLHAGGDWFTMTLLRGDTLEEATVRFSAPWSATVLPGCRWAVETELEVRLV